MPKSKIKDRVKNIRFLKRVLWRIKNRKMENSISKRIEGKNNDVMYGSLVKFNNCNINIVGQQNSIVINEMCEFNNVTFHIKGNNNKITIAEEVKFWRQAELWIEDDNCEISIGKQCSFEQVHLAATESGSKIVIGEDCMFAYDIELRTGDSHSIIDTITNKRINYAKSITLHNHIWVGAHCSILKGVTIMENSVVATRSLITKSATKPGVILAGVPGAVIKENINWDRKRIYDK